MCLDHWSVNLKWTPLLLYRRVFGPDYLVTDWVGKRNSSGEMSALAPWYAYRKP